MLCHHGWSLLLLLVGLRLSTALTIFGSSCSTAFVEEPHAFCVFPSQGPDGSIQQCQSSGKGPDAWWCPTTHKYCIDAAYKWCPDTSSTFGGSDPGKECHFPFWYQGVEYRHCLRLGTSGENYLWCSTTPGNYSGRWTRCRDLPDLMPCQFLASASPPIDPPNSSKPDDIQGQCVLRLGVWTCRTSLGETRRCPDTPTTEAGNDPGRSCRFPFKLNASWHSRCVQNVQHQFEWCATTDSFDRDRLWTRCRKLDSPGLSGVRLFLVAAGSLISAAFVASCVLYCCCEPSAPCQRSWRRRRLRRQHQREPPPPPPLPPPVAMLDGNKTNRSRRQNHQTRPSPTAPQADEVDSTAEFRLPTYEEVLALSAAEQGAQEVPPPPPPPPQSLYFNNAGKSVVSFDVSGGVPL